MVMRIGTLVLLLHLASGVAQAAAPRSPLPGIVQIQSVTHDARTPLLAGRRIAVRLRGTPGGVARFHIAGVVSDVSMREIRSSRDQQGVLYIGTYTVRPRDAARAAAVIAALKVGEEELIKASDRLVSIDARPPEVTERQPRPSGRLANLQPNIVLRFHDGESSVDPSRVALIVNGQDVTRRTAITGAFAAYTPSTPFQPGPVRVQAVVRDRAGNTTRTEWTFAVAPPSGLIKSVTLSSAGGLKPGDDLTVVMVGAPVGEATLTVKGFPRIIPMRESARAPGVYVGMYPIRLNDQGSLVSVSTRLRKGNRSSTASAVPAVPIFGRTPRPTIVAPAPTIMAGEQAIERIAVRGRTRPSFHLMGLLSAQVEKPSGNAWISLVAISTSARPDGSWTLSFGRVAPWPGAALFLTVVAIDPVGQRSPPVTIALGGSANTPRQAAPASDPVIGAHDGPAPVQPTPAPAQPAPAPAQPAPAPAQPTPAPAQPTPAPAQPAPAPAQPALAPPQPAPAVPTPPRATPSPVTPPPCPNGRIDPVTGRCVVPEDGTGENAADHNDQNQAAPEQPAPEPPAPDPPNDPKPDPPGRGVPSPGPPEPGLPKP